MKGIGSLFRSGCPDGKQDKPPPLAIRKARMEDAPAISRLKYDPWIQQNGARCRDIDSREIIDYAVYTGRYDMFYVLTVGEQVAAFILASSSENAKEEFAVQAIQEYAKEPFAYIAEVCTGSGERGKGFARRLVSHVLESSERCVYTSMVDDEAIVEASRISFAQKMGFSFAFHFSVNGGHRRAAYCCSPAKPKAPGLLAYSMFRTGAVAAAALVLSIVIALSSADYRTLGMSVVVIAYFSAVCYVRHRRYRAGAMAEIMAECIGVEKLARGRVEYCMDMAAAPQGGRVFYLVFPRKRRLREGEHYEMLFDIREDGAISETNLIAYRQIIHTPVKPNTGEE